jgi:hypothetical protein
VTPKLKQQRNRCTRDFLFAHFIRDKQSRGLVTGASLWRCSSYCLYFPSFKARAFQQWFFLNILTVVENVHLLKYFLVPVKYMCAKINYGTSSFCTSDIFLAFAMQNEINEFRSEF